MVSILYIIHNMSSAASQTNSQQLEPLSRSSGLRSDVTARLISAVFRGEINEGDRLVVQKLARDLGVSATPVREALVELESIGLVENIPNRGAVCHALGQKQIREIYQIRRILEVEATRAACGRIPLDDLLCLRESMQELGEGNGQNWSQRAMTLDRSLHEAIARHCDSDRLEHEIERYNALMQAIREAADNEKEIQRRAVEDHLAILDALIARESDDAATAMDTHIRNTERNVMEVLYQNKRLTDRRSDR